MHFRRAVLPGSTRSARSGERSLKYGPSVWRMVGSSPSWHCGVGITDVACFAARTGGVLCVKMTSTFSRTNSAANSAKRSLRPSAAIFDRNGASFDPAEFAQSLHKSMLANIGGTPTPGARSSPSVVLSATSKVKARAEKEKNESVRSSLLEEVLIAC